MKKALKTLGFIVSFVLSVVCCSSLSASAITAGPYSDVSTDGTYTYDVRHRTMVVSNSSINKNLDGYNQISKATPTQSSTYRFVSTYAALGNGTKTSSSFNGYNGIFNTPSSGPTPAALIKVGVRADNYQTGNVVISTLTQSTSSQFYVNVASPLISYTPNLTSYGSIEYRYPGASLSEYVAVTNH